MLQKPLLPARLWLRLPMLGQSATVPETGSQLQTVLEHLSPAGEEQLAACLMQQLIRRVISLQH